MIDHPGGAKKPFYVRKSSWLELDAGVNFNGASSVSGNLAAQIHRRFVVEGIDRLGVIAIGFDGHGEIEVGMPANPNETLNTAGRCGHHFAPGADGAIDAIVAAKRSSLPLNKFNMILWHRAFGPGRNGNEREQSRDTLNQLPFEL